MKESKGELIVTVELPGLTKDDVKIKLEDQTLTIEGERKKEAKEEKEGYFRSERSYRRFYRSIPLPPIARLELIRAQINNGVFEVTIPVAEETKNAREIPVSTPETAVAAA